MQGLAIVALILLLFRDGLEVEEEMLQEAWHLPLRKLVLAMPLTCVLVALVTHALTDLGWTESFLVGALLSPTDPVLSSAVITNPRVPRLIRHSLNLESGLNDGLALPAVLAFTAAAAGDEDFVWWEFVVQDVLVGLASGLAVAFVASRLMPRGRALGHEISTHQKALYALGVAFAAYGTATLPPEGNGFIAVFVAAIAFGLWRPDIRECFEKQSQDVIELVKVGIFLVFGAIITLDGLFGDGWAAVGIVAFTLLVARPVAVFSALAGTPPGRRGGEGVHGLVRAEGSGDNRVRAVRARLGGSRGRADRQHRGAHGARLDHRPRPHGPPGVGVDHQAHRIEERSDAKPHIRVVGCTCPLAGGLGKLQMGAPMHVLRSRVGAIVITGGVMAVLGLPVVAFGQVPGVGDAVGGVTEQLPAVPPLPVAPSLPTLPSAPSVPAPVAPAPAPAPAPSTPSVPVPQPSVPAPVTEALAGQGHGQAAAPSAPAAGQSSPAAGRAGVQSTAADGQAGRAGAKSTSAARASKAKRRARAEAKANSSGERASASTESSAAAALASAAPDLPANANPETVPFTGLQLSLLVILGLIAVAVGLTLRRGVRSAG